MRSRLVRILDEIQHTYPDASQRRAIMEYSNSMGRRIETVRALQNKEEDLCLRVVNQMQHKYHDYPKQHDAAWEKGLDDMALILRVCAQAIMLDDRDYLDEKLLFWVRDIFSLAEIDPKLLRDSFELLRAECRAQLDGEHFQLVKPLLDRVIEVLCEPVAA